MSQTHKNKEQSIDSILNTTGARVTPHSDGPFTLSSHSSSSRGLQQTSLALLAKHRMHAEMAEEDTMYAADGELSRASLVISNRSRIEVDGEVGSDLARSILRFRKPMKRRRVSENKMSDALATALETAPGTPKRRVSGDMTPESVSSSPEKDGLGLLASQDELDEFWRQFLCSATPAIRTPQASPERAVKKRARLST